MVPPGNNLQVDRSTLKVALVPQLPNMLALVTERRGRRVRFSSLGPGGDGRREHGARIIGVVPQSGIVPVEGTVVLAGWADKDWADDEIDILAFPVLGEFATELVTSQTKIEDTRSG